LQGSLAEPRSQQSLVVGGDNCRELAACALLPGSLKGVEFGLNDMMVSCLRTGTAGSGLRPVAAARNIDREEPSRKTIAGYSSYSEMECKER